MPHIIKGATEGFGRNLTFWIDYTRTQLGLREGRRVSIGETSKYIGDLTGLTAAHIMRMKNSANIPPLSTIEKLSVALPGMRLYLDGTLGDIVAWSEVDEREAKLDRESSVTIIYGKLPLELSDNRDVADPMLLRVAQNIRQRGVHYVFVGPEPLSPERQVKLASGLLGRFLVVEGWQSGSLDSLRDSFRQSIQFLSPKEGTGEKFWPIAPHGVSRLYYRPHGELSFGVFSIGGINPIYDLQVLEKMGATQKVTKDGWGFFRPDDLSELGHALDAATTQTA